MPATAKRRSLLRGLVPALLLTLPWPGRGDELAEIKALVERQSEQIRQLQDQVLKLEDEAAPAGGGSAASGGTALSRTVVEAVDQRIVDFENHPSSKLLISGYGAAGYTDNEDSDGSFGMLFVPIFHYKLSERLHLTGEVEFDLRGDESEVEVEYAQIDFLVNDYLTLTAGKFLVPFNTFSERYHPAWINELPSLPPIYGTHGGGGGIIPVLSDLGIQARGGIRLPIMIHEDASRLNYALYVTNGPRMEPESESDERFEHLAEFLEDEGAIASADDLLEALEIGHGGGTEIEFGETFTDNNSNKAIGGRLGLLPFPALEVGGSFMRGSFDDRGDLDFRLAGFDAAYRIGPLDLKGEYLRLDFDLASGGSDRTDGFYAQGGLRLRELVERVDSLRDTPLDRTELVLRYGEVDNGLDYRETTAGLVYWLLPSVPLKLAHTFRSGDRRDDELLLQLAFGF